MDNSWLLTLGSFIRLLNGLRQMLRVGVTRVTRVGGGMMVALCSQGHSGE